MQAVRSVASDSKFYWLPPDKEKTGTGSGHQHGHHFIVLGHQYGRRAVFSLTFTSAGYEPFIATKVKVPKVHFPEGRGVVKCRTWPHPCWEIYELSSLKCPSVILRPFFKQIGRCYLYTTI